MQAFTKRDPLGPIEFVVSLTVALPLFTILFALLLSTFGIGNFTFGGNESSVCVVDDNLGYGLQPEARELLFRDVPADVSIDSRATSFCTQHPTSTERWWSRVRSTTPALLQPGILLLIWWMVRRARRHGVFTTTTANSLTALGWYVIAATTIGRCISQLADARLYHLITRSTDPVGLNHLRVSWWAVVTGLGLISLGRVMRHAALLQDEVDATV